MLANGSGYDLDALEQWAQDNNSSMANGAVALKSPLVSKATVWPEVIPFEPNVKRETPQIAVSQRGDLLTELSKQIAGVVQFPVNTVFLHALGCVASALTKAFEIDYGFDSIPCNLYVLTAQPPSTGKSSVNGKLYAPIRRAYDEINEASSVERSKLEMEIRKLEKELDKDKSQEGGTEELLDKIKSKKERLAEIPEWEGTLTDTTIEAAEMVARDQDGMFNIISAEAESVNVIVGAVYSDEKGGGKSNQGLLLQAWDGEYVNTRRVGRKGYKGHARATISVIAQDDSVDTILAAGASGRGLTERFLILCEESMLGKRDHFKPYKFDKSLYRRYESMIKNVLEETDVSLHFSEEANEMIRAFITKIEPEMREDGLYSNALLTGFMGKADKQIRKIASVLHCVDHWQDGGDRSNVIKDDHTAWAIGIFDELSKTFISASDSLGYVGLNSEIEKMRSVVTSCAEKGRLKMSFSALRDKVKNVRPFKGSRNLSRKLREDVMPVLEKHNYIIMDSNDVYINPRLK